jgi:tRNA pseudouridine38-40 synthase
LLVPTQRYKLTIAYRGTRYHGWQSQPMLESYRGEPPPVGQGIPTIQETLARAIGEVVRHPVNLVGSSRTDAGVHAKGQIAHFDTHRVQIPPEGLRKAVNHALPGDVEIRELVAVADAFDAIRSTTSKRYQYFIWNSWERPIFFPDLAWHRWQKLDVPAMAQAARAFIGMHDFASFAKPGHGRENTIRTVLNCSVHQRGPRLIIGVEGTGFLWQMVRIMVGTLVEIGLGRIEPDAIGRMLEAKDRESAGPTAPPGGLFLQWIRTNETGKAVEPPPAPMDRPRPVVLRALRPQYHAGAVNVIKACGGRFSEEEIRNAATDLKFQNGLVAVVAGRVVGLVAYTVSEGVATVQWLAVAPEHQRQQVGRRLVEKLTDELKRGGVREIRVDPSSPPGAQAFFERMGFALTPLGLEKHLQD